MILRNRVILELHFLPPYAPDLNPDEFVWNYLKGTGVARKPLRKHESLKERVKADLEKLKQNLRLLRSFFMAESVVYVNDGVVSTLLPKTAPTAEAVKPL
jgi:hypothetical protein